MRRRDQGSLKRKVVGEIKRRGQNIRFGSWLIPGSDVILSDLRGSG